MWKAHLPLVCADVLVAREIQVYFPHDTVGAAKWLSTDKVEGLLSTGRLFRASLGEGIQSPQCLCTGPSLS